jgi:hypothetical protein
MRLCSALTVKLKWRLRINFENMKLRAKQEVDGLTHRILIAVLQKGDGGRYNDLSSDGNVTVVVVDQKSLSWVKELK